MSDWTQPRPWIAGIMIAGATSLYLLAPPSEAGADRVVTTFAARAPAWFSELDSTTARGFAATGSGDLSTLNQARGKIGELYLEVLRWPDDGPDWIAPCQHAAKASLDAHKAALSGNMRGAPDSFGAQSSRYLRASEACRKAIDSRPK